MVYVHGEEISLDFPDNGATKRIFSRKNIQNLAGILTTEKRANAANRVLKNLSFSFNEGDRIALIGGNGAGKSTFLKLLSGIYQPSAGTLDIDGSVATFFDNQLFMNLEATGYENIYLSGRVNGWSRLELKNNIKFIEEFTELGGYLSKPVNVYSNGMQGRLTFALAVLEKPQILLIDENIGAGDAKFQEKCEEYLQHYLETVSILVLASHSNSILKKYCEKGIVFLHGKIAYYGPLDGAIEFHNSL